MHILDVLHLGWQILSLKEASFAKWTSGMVKGPLHSKDGSMLNICNFS